MYGFQPPSANPLFISYSRKDKPFVERLIADLQARCCGTGN